jgi:hypothetical protein
MGLLLRVSVPTRLESGTFPTAGGRWMAIAAVVECFAHAHARYSLTLAIRPLYPLKVRR